MKYDAYDSEKWNKEFFDKDNGGYFVVDKQRIEQGKVSKNEKAKYEKEFDMCMTLAKYGYKVEYLKMTDGGFDIYLNGVSADLKKTASHNNILDYAKKATREQGAKIVVFELGKDTREIQAELEKLKRMKISVCYYFSNNKGKIHTL